MQRDHNDLTRLAARESYTGSRMTESQFDEAWHITGIINREIQKSGSFIEKLTDYAHAFSRNQRFDAGRGEVMLRDIYSARYGESMNQTRTALLEREAAIQDIAQDPALQHARSVVQMIQDGPTMPLYTADDLAGIAMAKHFKITEIGAKKLMARAFEAVEGRSLREVGKEVEERHHKPVRDAERAARRDQERQLQRTGPEM